MIVDAVRVGYVHNLDALRFQLFVFQTRNRMMRDVIGIITRRLLALRRFPTTARISAVDPDALKSTVQIVGLTGRVMVVRISMSLSLCRML